MAIETEITARTSNNTQVNGAGVDMQGWDGVLFVLALGTIDAAVDMGLFSDTTSAFSSATAITGAEIVQVPGTGDNQIVAIDLYRPSERHVRARVTVASGTTGAALSVTSMRYRATGRLPITQTLDQLVKVAEN
jgi:hypothetical protein